jgi:segregation and condensation protein B
MLKPAPSRLSRAALETLAIIAYKQPIIRSDIEHIRGVDSGGVLRVLMEKKLIRVLGRREIPGRPLIYATTKHFLEVFDLKNLNDLPSPKEIEELTAQEPDLEEYSEVDNAPTIPPPEAAATTAEEEKQADAVTLIDRQGDGRDSRLPGETAPAVDTPDPTEAPGIHTAQNGTSAADEAPDEASSEEASSEEASSEGASSEEASNEVTGVVTERSDGEASGRLDDVADDASAEALDEVSTDEASTEEASTEGASTEGATDVATDMTPEHDSLNHDGLNQDDVGKAIGGKGETAL